MRFVFLKIQPNNAEVAEAIVVVIVAVLDAVELAVVLPPGPIELI